MANQKDKCISFRVNDDDYDAITKAASANNLTNSDYCRRSAMPWQYQKSLEDGGGADKNPIIQFLDKEVKEYYEAFAYKANLGLEPYIAALLKNAFDNDPMRGNK